MGIQDQADMSRYTYKIHIWPLYETLATYASFLIYSHVDYFI